MAEEGHTNDTQMTMRVVRPVSILFYHPLIQLYTERDGKLLSYPTPRQYKEGPAEAVSLAEFAS